MVRDSKDNPTNPIDNAPLRIKLVTTGAPSIAYIRPSPVIQAAVNAICFQLIGVMLIKYRAAVMATDPAATTAIVLIPLITECLNFPTNEKNCVRVYPIPIILATAIPALARETFIKSLAVKNTDVDNNITPHPSVFNALAPTRSLSPFLAK